MTTQSNQRVITASGVGKADYYQEVYSSRQRAGYHLTFNQTLVLFFLTPLGVRLGASPYPWVSAPLAPGSMTHLIESSTGIATPYTVPAGYSMQLIEREWASNVNLGMWMYFDGMAISAPGVNTAGFMNSVISYNSLWLDPTAVAAHTFDVVVENFDPLNALEGGFTFSAIITEEGTPPLPTTKTVHCHHCGRDIPNIGRFEDKVTCPHCHGLIKLISFKPGQNRSR